MVDPLSCFLFQSVVHNWCNKGRGMCYSVWDVVYKRPIAANRNLPPATEPGRTAGTTLYLLVQAPPPPPPSLFPTVPDSGAGEAGTCARDRQALQLLALNVHVKLSDLT